MSSPVAVLISDIHFSIPTLELASKALTQAVKLSNDLEVPLIIAGDLHDTKANMRAECMTAMLDILKQAKRDVYILRGNHDAVHERSEAHALDALKFVADVVEQPKYVVFRKGGAWLIPYQHEAQVCVDLVNKTQAVRGSTKTLIMHQGVKSATSEGYPGDKTAIEAEAVAGLRVISGHYHRRQTIELPEGGVWDYLGNPYTLNYGEAKEPLKGFQVLFDDGMLEFIPTELRKHVVIEVDAKAAKDWDVSVTDEHTSGDLVWVKLKGPAAYLSKLTKASIAKDLEIDGPFRLDLIPDKVEVTATEKAVADLDQNALLDHMIQSSTVDDDTKKRLEAKWKTLLRLP